MIRNVVLGRLRATDDPDQRRVDVAMLRQGLAAVICEEIARVQFTIDR